MSGEKEDVVKRLRYLQSTSLADAFPFVVSSFLQLSAKFADDEEVKGLICKVLVKAKHLWGNEHDAWERFEELWKTFQV